MILPDLNLLVYAYNADAPLHEAARTWWETVLTDHHPVAVPWIVSRGFVRIMTHPRVLERPLRVAEAFKHVRKWLEWPSVQVLEPGTRHLIILASLLQEAGTGGNLVTDAALAALAIEYQCELCSNDTDFARFSGLRWRNPLRSSSTERRGRK